MSNIMNRLLTCIVCAGLALATHAATYTWSRHNISFETPEDGWVTYSSATRFEIQWDDMVMTVQLYAKEKGNEKKVLKNNLQRKAAGYNMYDTDDAKVKVKGFKTYSIEGTMPDGSRCVIADLVSKHQDLIIEITVNYLYGNREVVDDMIESFTEGKQAEHKEKKQQRIQSREDAERQQQQLEEQRKEQEKERRLQQERKAGKLHDA